MEEQSGKKKAKIKEKEFESLNVRTHEYCGYIDFRAIFRKSCLCYNGIVALINSFFSNFLSVHIPAVRLFRGNFSSKPSETFGIWVYEYMPNGRQKILLEE